MHLKTGDAFDLIACLGRDIEELSIPEEAIRYVGAHPFAVYYDTSLSGLVCESVSLGFGYDYADKTDKAKDIYISGPKAQARECRAYLDGLLGQCHNSGARPYAAVNGGALSYVTYYKDGVKYYLSVGSENDYYRLELSLEEPKNPPARVENGLIGQTAVPGSGMMGDISMFAPAAAVNNGESWFCSNCGRKNFGKFCEDCGTKKG